VPGYGWPRWNTVPEWQHDEPERADRVVATAEEEDICPEPDDAHARGAKAASRTPHDPSLLRPRCSAHSKQTGKPCNARAISGGFVCRMHGGGAPRVKRKAERRLEVWRELGKQDRWSWLEKTVRGEPTTVHDLVRYELTPAFDAMMRRNRDVVHEVLKFAPAEELRRIAGDDGEAVA
jgi:hypothetical protein